VVFLVYLIIIISFFDTFSQLPIIGPYAKELGATSLIIGVVIGMYSFSNMFGNVLAGQFIDKMGRKKIMLWGMIIAGTSVLMYSFVKTADQLLFIRFVHGIGGGLLVPAAFAYLGDKTTTDNRGKTMAISGAAIGIAAIIGPAYGGIIKEKLDIAWVFYSVGALMLIAAICVKIFLPEVFEKEQTKKFKGSEMIALLKKPSLINAYLSAFSLMFALGILTYMLPLKVESLGYTSLTTGLLLSSYGIIAIIFFVLPTNRISDKIGRMKPILVGVFTISISLFLLGIFSTISLLFSAMVLYGAGFALLFPAMTALIIDQSEKEERGRAFGLFYAFFSLGVVVGPLFVGALDVSSNIGLMIGSVSMLILGIYLFFRMREKKAGELG
jgi:DHA1 family multidrug resistance protein-like MFS transporter